MEMCWALLPVDLVFFFWNGEPREGTKKEGEGKRSRSGGEMATLKGLFPVSLPPSSADTINYAVVDAFTDVAFKGNPAAVCLLHSWEHPHWMQKVASEFNMMTAFLVPKASKITAQSQVEAALDNNHYEIRTFTPISEVEMCGHLTFASAYILFGSGLVDGDEIHFHPLMGCHLQAHRFNKPSNDDFFVELDLPVLHSSECDSELACLENTFKGIQPISWRKTEANDLLVELTSEEEVRNLKPCFEEIKKCKSRGLIVTGKASHNPLGIDCVSRFFAPKVGIDKDSVCGQAHCALAPIWASKLNKSNLIAFQASARTGTLHIRFDRKAKRVFLQGEATLVMAGVLFQKTENA